MKSISQRAYDADSTKSIDERFLALQKKNPDIIGWIHVFDTHINYPMLQGKTNQTYINLDPLRKFSLSGSIFLDSYTSKDFSEFSNVIYGHHMDQEKMFGDLDLYAKESYAKAHDKGNLYYEGAFHGFDVVSFVETNAYDSVIYSHYRADSPNKQKLIDYIHEKGQYQLREISTNDKLALFSTCADGTDNRYIVVVKINDKAYPEPKRKVYQQETARSQKRAIWMSVLLIFLVGIVVLASLLPIS
ncbi:class B sortase [Enterococcus cecorum]